MLERVTIIPEDASLGSLAEALVYYGHVDVAFQTGHIVELVEQIGIDGVIRLAESEVLTFVYNYGVGAVMNDDASAFPHAFMTVRLHGTAAGRPIRGAADEIAEAFKTRLGRGVISRSNAQRLANAVEVRSNPPPVVSKAAIQDILDEKFLTLATQIVLQGKLPSYPNIPTVRARGHAHGDNFYIESNIDFALASALEVERTGEEKATFGPGHIAVSILAMRDEIYYCGGRDCDIWSSDLRSNLSRLRINSLISRVNGGKGTIDKFEEIVLSGRSFSKAVESGARSILDILQFAESQDTQKFKKWLRGNPANADLFAEYEKSKLATSSLISSLPFKSVKLLFFSGAGIVLEKVIGGTGIIGATLGSAVSNVAMGAADEVLMRHLSIGWKPNQWVTRTAGPFLRRE